MSGRGIGLRGRLRGGGLCGGGLCGGGGEREGGGDAEAALGEWCGAEAAVQQGGSLAHAGDLAIPASAAGLSAPGTIEAVRGIALTRAHVAAFFDLHLKGRKQPLLDAPGSAGPEVAFQAPAAS
ncbi:hypothetical protein [Nonomuraea insulae]|uniref:Uncharacterized protein n=1 Tax=Nonomuraea insulae TaxID=1616787 RepID=A0ABW1DBF3_9ACTN